MSGITIAVIVGIEKYADAGVAPTLPAPCLDAIRMASKMPRIGVKPAHTFLFLQSRTRFGAEQTAYETLLKSLDPSIQPRGCDRDRLSAFWRDELQTLQAANPDSRLFFYWSGHGFSDANAGVPLLLCADYTSKLTDRVVNRDELLTRLHSTDYENLTSQLLCFDACANNVPTGGIAATTAATWSGAIDQVSIAAAPRGIYAHGDETGGQFTRVLLEAVSAFEAWPDPRAFWTDLKVRLEAASMSSATVSFRSGGTGVADDLLYVGTVTPARAELEQSLGDVPIKLSDYLAVYRWVTDTLSAEPNRGKATDIRGILRDLWDARGELGSVQAPYSVVEFVARLLNAFPAAAPLQQWLDNRAYVRTSDLVEAEANLNAESKALILEVEIVEGTRTRPGEIVEFETRLFRFDRVTLVETSWVNPQLVDSPANFRTLLTERLREAHNLATDTYQTTLTVEVLTNLFNIAPHQFDSVAPALLPTTFGSDHRWRCDGVRAGIRPSNARRRGSTASEDPRRRHCLSGASLSDAQDKVPDCRVVFVRYALPSETGLARTVRLLRNGARCFTRFSLACRSSAGCVMARTMSRPAKRRSPPGSTGRGSWRRFRSTSAVSEPPIRSPRRSTYFGTIHGRCINCRRSAADKRHDRDNQPP